MSEPAVKVAPAAAPSSGGPQTLAASAWTLPTAAALPEWLRQGLSLLAGAALACAFAPLQLWWLAVLCPALQMWLWEEASPASAARSGFWFGAGTFALGTWWLYISIHNMGGAPIWLAVFLVAALVGIMGLYQGLLGWLAARLLPTRGAARYLLGLPGLWLLIEWWRGWFLTGFPWLSLGYSQTDTPLAGVAPVLGVYGISALLLVCAGALVALLRSPRGRVRIGALVALAAPWVLGALLARLPWTHPAGASLTVAVLQGAIPQDLKWQEANVGPTRTLYAGLEQQALDARLIVWPEAAVPEIANDDPQFLGQIYSAARMHGSDVLMGILRVDERGRSFDSIMAMSDRISFYDKHHLVPYAEYFPVPQFVRSWLRMMDLPNLDFTAGPAVQAPMSAAGTQIAAGICYEDGYGNSLPPVLRRGATVLVNVTNDAWFGHSWARYQHFQIARMRAIESRRPLIRAAQDGVSALIGPNGEVLAQAPEFRPVVLRGSVQPRAGLPPYARRGNATIVVLGLLAAALATGMRLIRSTGTGGRAAGL